MSNSHFAARYIQPHIFPVAITIITIFIALTGSEVQQELRYERTRIFAGEVWRFFSAHFVHLGWVHLLMNLAALGLIWGLAWRTLRASAWVVISSISMASISAGLLIFNPALEWYVGLSGMLHGLFLAGIMAALVHPCDVQGCARAARDRMPKAACTAAAPAHRFEIVLLLLTLFGKVAWEQLYGALPGSAEFAGGAVVVDAHLYGLIGGLVGVLPYVLVTRHSKPMG